MNIQDLRQDTPALEDVTYLNTGASGPSPRKVVDTIEAELEDHEYRAPGKEGMYTKAFDTYERARDTIAEFVRADSNEIALTHSTTDGINRIVTSLDWEAGDRVVITDFEHSAGELPWKRLQRQKNIEIEVLRTENGVLDPGDFERVAEDSKLLCMSAIDWQYGRSQPVAEMVDIAQRSGTLSLIDAVQVPGQKPLDVSEWGADFVAAAGHKWLLGPWGAGFVYVDTSRLDALEPTSIGYRSVEDPNADSYTFNAGANRLEIGTVNPALFAGLTTAIGIIEDIGLDMIQEQIKSLTTRLKADIPEDQLYSPSDYHTGLVTINVPDPEAAVRELKNEDIIVRSLPHPNAIRISLHAFNTIGEVDAALDALESILD